MYPQQSQQPDTSQAQPENTPLYFRCRMCGECCSSWNIPIDGEKARALLQREWFNARLNEKRRELVKVTDALYRIPLTDENVCVFLAEDRRCLIEANEGPALKPDECKRFPFASVASPEGEILHDTSASCKIVAEEMLTAFRPILPAPGTSQQPEGEPLTAKIALDSLRKISFTAYQSHLVRLKAIFENPETTVPQALKLAQVSLRGKQSAGKSFTFSDFAERWVTVFFLRKPYGSLSWWSLARGRTYDDPRIFGLRIDLVRPSALAWSAETELLIKAFLYNLLSRKVLLTHGHTLSGMLSMACVAYFLVRWYASILANLQDRNRVETEDVSMAIRLVERYYTGHQPRFLAWFASPWRGWLLGRLLLA